MSWVSDLAAIVRGVQRVNRAFVCQRWNELECFWSNSSLRPVVRGVCDQFEDAISNAMLRQTPLTVCLFHSLYQHKHFALILMQLKCLINCVDTKS